MSQPHPLKIKIQLYCGDEIAMGPGKADLLDAIAAHGSISGAARALGLSYRRAWMLVDAMNRCWREAIVDTTPGKARGGGARVTAFGADILGHYRALQLSLAHAAQCADSQALGQALLSQPKDQQSR